MIILLSVSAPKKSWKKVIQHPNASIKPFGESSFQKWLIQFKLLLLPLYILLPFLGYPAWSLQCPLPVLGILIYVQQSKSLKRRAAATKDSKADFLDIVIPLILYKQKETITPKFKSILSAPVIPFEHPLEMHLSLSPGHTNLNKRQVWGIPKDKAAQSMLFPAQGPRSLTQGASKHKLVGLHDACLGLTGPQPGWRSQTA